jgi:hypothetical protein
MESKIYIYIKYKTFIEIRSIHNYNIQVYDINLGHKYNAIDFKT